eukprot:scaffold28606_cov161-Amphora_coffeaeformis.AAC.2
MFLAGKIKGHVTPNIGRHPQRGWDQGQQRFHHGQVRTGLPHAIVQDGPSHGIAHIQPYVGLVDEKFDRFRCRATTGQVDQVFAVHIAHIKGLVLLVQHVTQGGDIVGTNSTDNFHGVSVRGVCLIQRKTAFRGGGFGLKLFGNEALDILGGADGGTEGALLRCRLLVEQAGTGSVDITTFQTHNGSCAVKRSNHYSAAAIGRITQSVGATCQGGDVVVANRIISKASARFLPSID